MKRRHQITRALAILAAVITSSAEASDFYKDKTLAMVVGFAPGGGVDTGARTIARHLVRFIPGAPNVIIRNMEGAAGVTSANHLANRVDPDGLTIGVPGRGWFVEGIMKTAGANFDPTKLSYVGSSGPTNSALWVRPDTGVSSFADFKGGKAASLLFGSLGPGTNTGLVPALFARQGLPLKVIFGYGSTSRILVAIEQNEVNAIFTPVDTFALHGHMIENKTVIPILQTRSSFAGVPLIQDVVRPSDVPLLEIVTAAESFGLMVVGPGGIPANRLSILRSAFLHMADDPQYRSDALKVALQTAEVLSGDELGTMMKSLTSKVSPETAEEFKKLRGR